ncbi:response regulator [Haloarcula sp. JP-Z28]|jgi:DNA-binding response OmpR family regulator|uniref:HoxA-like transcriptional regulator n=1 Tax=Haloarcula marismortui (strain ATCC 43049 / DSM 3752 / JCM 8966 / VKM B-1809) TaxID=272569 RepID=Q5UXK4_HALMA|nr:MULTISPECIES: response regulator [Haloarcula]AAV47999.1 HoxA-like transcriptional regulator [Haloarcula marismortui ATCC 43049]NHN62827.1 response regulator [Haloarcula sp. JP-Z28]QCP92670.1 response regulator [Haloarcula marismortui ATCC 43049]
MTKGRQVTILVVDDEPAVADVYADQLGERYTVETAYSGEAALSKLDSAVDVVLLDRRMPDLSGDEVLSAIREKRYDTRVAMVTAVDPDFDIIEMPFDDYVLKPVSKADLFQTIEQLLLYADYEERLRECYSLTAKYAALESSKPQAVLDESEEFTALRAELEEVRAELDELTDSFDATDFELLFRNFETDESIPDNTQF